MQTIIPAQPGFVVLGFNFDPDLDPGDFDGVRQSVIAWQVCSERAPLPITVNGICSDADRYDVFAIFDPSGIVILPGYSSFRKSGEFIEYLRKEWRLKYRKQVVG